MQWLKKVCHTQTERESVCERERVCVVYDVTYQGDDAVAQEGDHRGPGVCLCVCLCVCVFACVLVCA